MKKFIIVVLIIVVAGYFYPQIIESKGGPCQAFEAKLSGDIGNDDANVGMIAGLVSGISDGEFGRRIATREYESLPASLACVRAYYTIGKDDIRL